MTNTTNTAKFTLTAINGETDPGFILTHVGSGISISDARGRNYCVPTDHPEKGAIIAELVDKWATIAFPALPAMKWTGQGYAASRGYCV